MLIVLLRHGEPLAIPGGYKIGPRADSERGQGERDRRFWRGKKVLDIALEDIRFDYAFIALYTATLALTCFFGASLFTGWLARAGTILGWAMFIAGPMDVFENLGMTAEIGGNYAIAPIVFTCRRSSGSSRSRRFSTHCRRSW